jgi:hypothetical protein
MSCFLSPLVAPGIGPGSSFEAFTRSAFAAEMMRASTDVAMVGTATPSSAASWTVHLPVPFMPVASRM